MPGETPSLDNAAGGEPAPASAAPLVGEIQLDLPVLTDVVEMPLPEVTEVFGDPAAVLASAENLSAYDAAAQGTIKGTFDTSGLSLVPQEGAAPTQELDEQGSAMMALIEDMPMSSGAGVGTNPAEQPVPPAASPSEGAGAETPPPAAAERAAEKKEIDKDILDSYQERFGINPEELKGIEGFETLSRGQQKQVLENLAQLTIGRIREEAVEGHDKDLALEKADASKFGSKFLGKVWLGLKDSFTKKFDIVNREKKLASEIEKGGMKEHEEVLKQMVAGMKTFGPAIKENAETGGLEIQFIETEGLTPGVAKVAESYNEKGTAFSKIPYEWSLDTATSEQKEAFAAAKEAYETERSELLLHMKRAGGKDGDVQAIAAMAKTESIIEMQRFMQTAPDAAAELSKIEKQSAWGQALRSVGTERGLYMAGGYLARTAIAGMGAFVAAPAVAFASGAIRGWQRTGAELRQQDIDQRKGVAPADTEKTAQTKALIAKINESIATTTDEHMKDQLKMDLYELNKSLRGTTKNMIESANKDDIAGDKEAESGDRRRGAAAKISYLKAKIDSLDEKISDATTEEERTELSAKKIQLMGQLNRRMNYTKQKISEGRVVFGAEAERIGNQYALTRSMAEAEVVLAAERAVDENGDKAAERLARLLNSTDADIKRARFNKKLGKAVTAGAIGGVIAEVGVGAADLMKWMNGGDSEIRGLIMGHKSAAEGAAVLAGSGPIAEAVPGTYARPLGEHASFMDHAGLPNEPIVPNPIDFPTVGAATPAYQPDTSGVNGLDLPPDYVFPTQDAVPELSAEETLARIAAGQSSAASVPGYQPDTSGVNGLDLPPDYVFPTQDAVPELSTAEEAARIFGEKLGSYDVQPGDTVTSILRAKFPGITDTQIENLRGQDLRSFGISSGNLDRLNYGGVKDHLDLDKIAEAIKAGRPSGALSHAAVAGSHVSAFDPEHPDFRGPAHEIPAYTTPATVSPIRESVEVLPSSPVPDTTEFDHANELLEEQRAQAEAALARAQAEAAARAQEAAALAHAQAEAAAREQEAALLRSQQAPVPPPRPHYGMEQEMYHGQRAGSSGVERIVHVRATPEQIFEQRMAAIDTQEAARLRAIDMAYERKLQQLALRAQTVTENRNVGTVNRAIGQLPNILHGRTSRLGQLVEREAVSRLQGGVRDSVSYEQAVRAASIAHDNEIERAKEMFEAARMRLEERSRV